VGEKKIVEKKRSLKGRGSGGGRWGRGRGKWCRGAETMRRKKLMELGNLLGDGWMGVREKREKQKVGREADLKEKKKSDFLLVDVSFYYAD
jgi:hypothetical protein